MESVKADVCEGLKGLFTGGSLVDVDLQEAHAKVFDSAVNPVWQRASWTLAVDFVRSEGLDLGEELEHDHAEGEDVRWPSVGLELVSLGRPVLICAFV